MDLNLLCDRFQSGDISKDNFIEELKKLRAFSKSDRFKLKVVDNAPFSMWACDDEYIIRYWECECERIYGYTAKQAIGQRYLELFVAAAERNQSEIECTKIIEGHSAPGEFINNIAVDFDSLGRDVTLMTNCFRIFDEESQKWLQAEIALPTDVKKVVKKHADMLRNYQKLRSMIIQYDSDSKSFLDSVSTRAKNLTAVTRRINHARRKNKLPQEDIIKLDSLQSSIEKKHKEIIHLIDEKIGIIKEAKSIEQCLSVSADYIVCKNKCGQMLEDIQDYLDEIVDELKVESISCVAELSQAKKEAIIDCDAQSDTLLVRINTLIQIAYDASDNLSFGESNDDIPRQRIGQYTSFASDVRKLLSTAKANIDGCTTKTQITKYLSSFTDSLASIEKKIDSYEENK